MTRTSSAVEAIDALDLADRSVAPSIADAAALGLTWTSLPTSYGSGASIVLCASFGTTVEWSVLGAAVISVFLGRFAMRTAINICSPFENRRKLASARSYAYAGSCASPYVSL